jgi:hypothetical protein
MSEEDGTQGDAVDAFFVRNGLAPSARRECHAFLTYRFSGQAIRPAKTQGYCSYTIVVGDDTIVQFRPSNYELDLQVTAAARDVYGNFAPSTEFLTILELSNLLVYIMDKMPGISYRDFKLSEHVLADTDTTAFNVRKTLCIDFATFLARAWSRQNNMPLPLGTIGLSIRFRLEKLSIELPLRFRPVASRVLGKLESIEALPWILTHGDIVASNIMINSTTGHLHGFVDWAEAELLPFGTCLYGLEEILGSMTDEGFVYHAGAEECRAAFWKKLTEEIPALSQQDNLDAVNLARYLGILLWHGFAFDDGAINRVVQEDRDVGEIGYLDALLELQSPLCHL